MRCMLIAVVLLSFQTAAAANGATKWQGGKRVPKEGERLDVILIEDNDKSKVVHALTNKRVPLDRGEPISVSVWAKTKKVGQHFTVGLVFYDQRGSWLKGKNIDMDGVGDPQWTLWQAVFRQIPKRARFAEIRVGATEWFVDRKGTAWFADPEVKLGEPWQKALGVRLPEPQGVTLWANRAEQQLTPDTEPPAEKGTVQLFGMRGEFESFQIGLRGRGTLEAVEVNVLDRAEGGRIRKDDIDVRGVDFVHVKKASDPTARTGMLADPLPPLALPKDLTASQTSVLWVSVRLRRNLAPGVYRGTLGLRFSGGRAADVPMRVKVYGGRLPRESSLRTSFEVPGHTIARFHGVDRANTRRYRSLLRGYYQELARARISATDPMQDAQADFTIADWGWVGGQVVSGKGSKRAIEIRAGSIALRSDVLLLVKPVTARRGQEHRVSWDQKGTGEFKVRITAHDAGGGVLKNIWLDRRASGGWQRGTARVRGEDVPTGTAGIKVRFIAEKGAVAFDNVSLRTDGARNQRLPNAGFEADILSMPLSVDFKAYDKNAAWALDRWKMNGFRIWIDGFPFGRRGKLAKGALFGFSEEQPEFLPLLKRVVATLVTHMKKEGWLEKGYFYFYDEPQPPEKALKIVARSYRILKGVVPHIPRAVTGHLIPEASKVVTLWVPLFEHLSPGKVTKAKKEGKEVWGYVAGHLRPPVPNLLLDHPAIESRLLPLAVKSMGLDGWLHWSVAEWADYISGKDWVDRYERTMTTIFENGSVDTGNADGWLFYPPTRAPPREFVIAPPIISQRWEMIREGMEDVDRLHELEKALSHAKSRGALSPALEKEARDLIAVPEQIASGRGYWTRDLAALDAYRRRVMELLDALARR